MWGVEDIALQIEEEAAGAQGWERASVSWYGRAAVLYSWTEHAKRNGMGEGGRSYSRARPCAVLKT